jgi:hypothetical protein
VSVPSLLEDQHQVGEEQEQMHRSMILDAVMLSHGFTGIGQHEIVAVARRSIASEIRQYVPQLLAVHRSPCDSLEHMPCHAERKLMLSHEHLPGLLFPE